MALTKKLLMVFFLIALCCATLSCEKSFDGLGIHLKMDRKKLSNGMTLILVEDHTVPVVSYQTWYRVGSVDEQPGMTGISHLFEHLMFKGTPKYPAKQFFEQLEAKGAEVNAYTTRDYTVYYENFVPDLFEKVVDMESDRMQNLTIDQEVLDSERMVVLEERKMRTDNSPEGKIQEALWALAYRFHPYRWPVVGYPPDLLNLKVEDLTTYFHAHYQPANAVVVVVGDIQTDQAFELIKKYYEKVPASPKPARNIPKEPEQEEERTLILHDRVASEVFSQAYHVTSASDDDSYALDVLSNILFEGATSRAYRKLVEEKNIVQAISGTDFTPTYSGLLMVTATMKVGVSAEQGQRELQGVIDELQKNGVTDDEIKIAVKQRTVEMVDSVRTPQGLAQLIGVVQTIFGEPERFASDLAKYTRVKAADVKRVANQYLIPNNRSVVTLVPGKAEEN